MNSKILIIYPFANQENLVSNMVLSLRENHVIVDGFNSSNYKFIEPSHVNIPFHLKILSKIISLPIFKIKGLVYKIFNRKNMIIKLAKDYDIIDFHVLHRQYDDIIFKLINTKIVKLTIWGSDFYRADNIRREQQRPIYQKCDRIQILTSSMKSDFLNYYKDFEDKIDVVNFGVSQFDVIDKVEKTIFSKSKKNQKYFNKRLIVCGYNGIEAQQHNLIIDAINNLDQITQEKIFLVFPMTYGGDKKYKFELESRLKKTGIPFKILKTHLSKEEVALLRLESDIVINIQLTDAFSASLQEHLYAENLLLVGDWLPYSILDDNHIYYKKSSLKNLSIEIADCIENFQLYQKKTKHNKNKMHELSSWHQAGKKMSLTYKSFRQKESGIKNN